MIKSKFETEKIQLIKQTENFIEEQINSNNGIDKKLKIRVSKEYEKKFYELVDKVNLKLMQDKDNFYGYFLFQMKREIRFDISSPTGINFKDAGYILYFNPIIFLELDIKQMQSTIKHEILHIISNHLIRSKQLDSKYSKVSKNIAMDIVVNKYLDNLYPFATTLEYINNKYGMNLQPFESFEYYVDKIQTEIDLFVEDDVDEDIDEENLESIKREYNINKTHDIWNESDDIEEEVMKEFTKKYSENSQRGEIPSYINELIKNLSITKGEIHWSIYLKQLIKTLESNKKKTITRKSRRQPQRLDLRGELRNHKSKIAVAIDTSGSISNEEFKQAIKEITSMIKYHNQEITIIECDDEIRKVYKLKSYKDIQERNKKRGATKFTPVFEYLNKHKFDLLIYFTDGEGEDRLNIIPRGYKILWIISGKGKNLSLNESYGTVKKLSHINIKEDKIDMSDVRDDGYSMNNQAPML